MLTQTYLHCPVGSISYIIKPGDNFYNLALRFNTTLRAITIANPHVNPYGLYIGQQVCIPRGPATPSCTGVYYTVRAGDNMYSIAQRNSIPLQDLIRANPGVNPYHLYIGQVICIPQAPLPVRKRIPVMTDGQTEFREATLHRSAQGYAIYVLDNFRFAGEEPGKDLLSLAVDNRFFTRIERLPPNSDIEALRANALTDLHTTGTPTELKGTQIADPFFRNAIFFLAASSPSLTRDIILMRIDNALFRFTMNVPSGEPAKGVVPSFFAMLKTIIPQ